jgi:hypothetical protein
MRSDLSRVALSTDLQIVASRDQSAIPNTRVPAHELGQPLCPTYEGCRQIGTLPRDQAASYAASQVGRGGGCQTSARRSVPSFGGFGAIGAFLALAIARSVRNRRRNAIER